MQTRRDTAVIVERQSSVDKAEIDILHLLGTRSEPLAPADLILELERAGLLDADIRAAIWYLLDHHRVNLTTDLRLALPRTAA
jgi:hypothetical protein